MNKIKTLLLGLCLIATVGAMGCKDDDGGVLTSVDGSKRLSELSDDEAKQLCEDFNDAMTDVMTQETICTMYAIEMAKGMDGGEEACKKAYEMCMEEKPDENLDEDDCSSDDTSDDLEECDATVSEMDKCATDMISEFKKWTGDLSCSSKSIGEPEEPDSCKALEEKCPDMMDDDFD